MERSMETANGAAISPVRALPDVAFTRGGVAFHPNDDVWQWLDGPFQVNLDFRRFTLPETALVSSLKYTLHVVAKKYAPTYVVNLFQAFVHFLQVRASSAPLTTITAAEVSNYMARLHAGQKWRLGTLNALLQKWQQLALPGVDAECTQYLLDRRKPGNTKGAAVRQRDPIEGPFSEDEYTALYKAVDTAYGSGDIPLWVAVLTRLLFACGGRISQYASLKAKDLMVENSTYVLHLPQVKTRLEHSRSAFVQFRLSPQTGRLVEELVVAQNETGLGGEAPLFPASEVVPGSALGRLRSENDLFQGHCTSGALSAKFTRLIAEIAPQTARLDFATLPVTTKRFRSTFGTRLAEEGAGRVEIAERLGHVDLQHVDVYFEASPAIVDRIDEAMGRQLAPLARAFKGRLVEDEAHSTHKGELGSRIIDFRVSSKPLASCAGKANGCAFNKPVACYTCFRFEPWLDGPHEKVLKRLEADRGRWAGDARMAAINDAAIEAVREVIAECDQARNQSAAGGAK
jgi:integrase